MTVQTYEEAGWQRAAADAPFLAAARGVLRLALPLQRAQPRHLPEALQQAHLEARAVAGGVLQALLGHLRPRRHLLQLRRQPPGVALLVQLPHAPQRRRSRLGDHLPFGPRGAAASNDAARTERLSCVRHHHSRAAPSHSQGEQ